MADIIMSLADLLKRGGIYRNIPGVNPRMVLGSLIRALPPFPAVDPDKLLEAVLEREALMPTGIGNGIAVPHPRNPIIEGESGQFAALAFPENAVDWNALDGKRVDSVLLIVSASAKQHLGILSEITYFSRRSDFIRLLAERASLEDLLTFIRKAEKDWNV